MKAASRFSCLAEDIQDEIQEGKTKPPKNMKQPQMSNVTFQAQTQPPMLLKPTIVAKPAKDFINDKDFPTMNVSTKSAASSVWNTKLSANAETFSEPLPPAPVCCDDKNKLDKDSDNTNTTQALAAAATEVQDSEKNRDFYEMIDAFILMYDRRTNEYIAQWGEDEWTKQFYFPNYDYRKYNDFGDVASPESKELNTDAMDNHIRLNVVDKTAAKKPYNWLDKYTFV